MAPDFPDCRVHPSPNFGDRSADLALDMLILHYTGMPNGQGAESWLTNPASQVSSHYLVHESGEIVQMVIEEKRAWHAGKSCWSGLSDLNSASIGIEIVNPGHEFGYRAFPGQQITAVIALCQDILRRRTISPQRVLAHSDIAPARKEDPGELFPWAQLHAHGIGHWVPESSRAGGQFLTVGDRGDSVAAFQGLLALYGYCIDPSGEFDEQTRLVTVAFQRHFRPSRVDGIADIGTIDTLHALLRDLPPGA